ncbi:TPA: signal peptidase I [Streptococcus suis]|uniref:Signal peptidase I n=2 Tax=Streptococcus suis TaxID=1307 RepID=A0A0K2E8P6_STRSU|nr:signal peptidase I [Streptococcus suis]MBY4634597.1 signal peptidase I [Streptococcus suis]MCK4041177.1 signal peptidase I [Streptococcus suis]MCK4075022.1 signal peptidase I [Streptococcus suis]NQJ66810.1 signal peptidase I [Streptococcus suis]NQM46535.1 signal peptidase I [Streptococcus suis]
MGKRRNNPIQKDDKNQSREGRQGLKKFITKCAVIAGIGYIFLNFVVGVIFVKNIHMFPNLKVGDLAIYSRIYDNIKINDVVVYQEEDYERVGRVVAQSGDIVDITDKGELMVNGHIREEELPYQTSAHSSGVSYPYEIPAGSYFVLYDFRKEQTDSRFIGAIPINKIKGVVTTLIRVRDI